MQHCNNHKFAAPSELMYVMVMILMSSSLFESEVAPVEQGLEYLVCGV